MKKLTLLILLIVSCAPIQEQSRVGSFNNVSSGQTDINTKNIERLDTDIKELTRQLEHLSNRVTDLETEPVEPVKAIQGFGKHTTGGENGQVIKVTNLNRSGVGSFTWAVEQNYPRIIEFEVGGIINLAGRNLTVHYGNLTIKGETAPSPVTIIGGMFEVYKSNVLVTHMRFRAGAGAPPEVDSAAISAFNTTIENVVFAHCSFSDAKDENFNARGSTGIVRNITLYRCITSNNSYAMLFDGDISQVTIYESLLIFNNERHPRIGSTNYSDISVEFINNLVYGFKWGAATNKGCKFSIVNNYYKDSPSVARVGVDIVSMVLSSTGNIATTEAYISGNIIPNGSRLYDANVGNYLVATPTNTSGIVPINAVDVPNEILATVGASLPSRDAIDTQLVLDWINNN